MLRRDAGAHKNDFGHVLVLAGSAPMLGAAALCSLAAMRAGAGLVTCGIPQGLNLALQKKLSPVVMTLPLPEDAAGVFGPAAFRAIKKMLPKFDALAVGPGLGKAADTRLFVRRLISQASAPMVIDADALNIISEDPRWLLKSKAAKILTPHPGEMARLSGKGTAWVEKNRKSLAADFARAYNSVVVLKGRHSVVASPGGRLYLNRTGNAGMATAGSGDVLTGMAAALLGQGTEAFEAACFAARWHGAAGDLAARAKTRAAMTAADIIEYIPAALKKI